MRRTIITLTTLVAVLAAASGALAAGDHASARRACGTLRAAGATWAVTAVDVPCGTAKSVIRSVAAKRRPGPAGVLPGTTRGLRCRYGKAARAETVVCGRTGTRKLVVGVRR